MVRLALVPPEEHEVRTLWELRLCWDGSPLPTHRAVQASEPLRGPVCSLTNVQGRVLTEERVLAARSWGGELFGLAHRKFLAHDLAVEDPGDCHLLFLCVRDLVLTQGSEDGLVSSLAEGCHHAVLVMERVQDHNQLPGDYGPAADASRSLPRTEFPAEGSSLLLGRCSRRGCIGDPRRTRAQHRVVSPRTRRLLPQG